MYAELTGKVKTRYDSSGVMYRSTDYRAAFYTNDEGYVENPANPQYFYFRHDHLGDNREVWLANTN